MSTVLKITDWCTRTPEAPSVTVEYFALSAGEIVTLEGHSGAGKSLFLRSLVGLEPVDESSRLSPARSWPELRRRIQLVPQHPILAVGTVREALLEGFRWRSSGTAQSPNEAVMGLELSALGFAEPGLLLERPASTLSGGERTRVALLRSLLLNPKVLLLDETTAPLDLGTTLLFEARLRAWVRESPRRAILISSHDASQRQRLAFRRLKLERGRIFEPRPGTISSNSVIGESLSSHL